MSEKVLTAKVKLDTTDVDKKLASLNRKLNNISKKLNKVGLQNQTHEIQNVNQEIERMGNLWRKTTSQMKSPLQVFARQQQSIQNTNKCLKQEWVVYNNLSKTAEILTNKEIERERNRQQSLKTLGEGDKAAKRLIAHQEKLNRLEYESWWTSQLIRREWQQAHPTLNTVAKGWSKVDSKIKQVISGSSRLTPMYTKTTTKVTSIVSKIREWYNNQKNVSTATKSTNSHLSSVWSKLKGIAATYLGIMGMRTIVDTTDTITSAQNKINYISAQQLGNSAFTADGQYSQSTLNMTQDALDKMYASSQAVRMSYTDMMSNVSKSMTLAGDAFQGSIDNAIRFQEIMAEAYAVGGASATEMSTSMYQLIQALGAGILAGDELRSVREGAPLAYAEIEKFVQEVYQTEESLKDLASQGKVTSDIVVAAVMGIGDEMDRQFALTKQTFAQTWTQIKNAAVYAFKPVAEVMTNTLNIWLKNGLINKLETFFISIAKALMIFVTAFNIAIEWIVENWSWLKNVLIAGIFVLAGMWIWQAGVAIVSFIQMLLAMTPLTWSLMGILALILSLIYVFVLWKTGAIDTCQAIVGALAIVALAIMVIGLVTGNVYLLIVGLVLALVALIFCKLEEISGKIGSFASWLLAVIDNIGIAFSNLWNGVASWCYNAIADMLESCDWLIKGVNKIREALGKEPVDLVGTMRAKANEASSKTGQEYVSTTNARLEGYNKGYAWGAGIKDKINSWGSKFQTWSLDNIGSSLGLDFNNLYGNAQTDASGYVPNSSGFPNASNPKYNAGNSWSNPDPKDLLASVDGIADDASKIADSVELSEEDLHWLRDLANVEWKKEYTVANINVDMKNDNTINGVDDTDGFFTKLTDRMYDELVAFADGVYV